ncbi:MAG: ABC transporter permease [Candidatus Lustribacter sp.]|jgi:sulfonate transport system permease protein
MATRFASFVKPIAAQPGVCSVKRPSLRWWIDPRTIALGLLLPVTIVVAWSIAVRLEIMRPQILPSPLTVLATARDLFVGGELLAALGISLGRVVVGLAIGSLLGILVGIATGRSRTIDAYFGPTIRGICQIPTIAWLPFFMIVFGIGEGLKLALIAKASFLPLFVNTSAAMRAAPERFHEVADVLELDRWQRLRLVVLPAALPLVASGFRMGLSNAWHVLVVVEMVAAAAGVGHLMAWSRTLFQLDAVFVTIVVIGITGWAMDATMRLIESRLSPWTANA